MKSSQSWPHAETLKPQMLTPYILKLKPQTLKYPKAPLRTAPASPAAARRLRLYREFRVYRL